MTDESLGVLIILPDSHGSTNPIVTLAVSYYTASLFAYKWVCMRKFSHFVLFSVEEIESFLSTHHDFSVLSFANTVNLIVFQDVMPSEILEAESLGIEAGYAVGSTNP